MERSPLIDKQSRRDDTRHSCHDANQTVAGRHLRLELASPPQPGASVLAARRPSNWSGWVLWPIQSRVARLNVAHRLLLLALRRVVHRLLLVRWRVVWSSIVHRLLLLLLVHPVRRLLLLLVL
jgi:hypothetical protein